MVAHAFDNNIRTGVTYGEPLAGNTVDIRFTAGRAVECSVPDDDIIFSGKGRFWRRLDNQLASGQSFTDIVIGVTFDRNGDALRYECAKTLSGRAREVQSDRIIRQTCCAVFARQLAAQNRTDGAVDIGNRQGGFHHLAGFQRRRCQIQ
ncbi:hypothetical protein D3C73_1245250 [compost metagenome]